MHKRARASIREGVVEEIKESGIEGLDEDVIEGIVDDITGEVKRSKIKYGLLDRMRQFTMAGMLLVSMFVTVLSLGFDGKFVEIEPLKQGVVRALINKSTLEEIKVVFNNRSSPTSNPLGPLINRENYYNRENLSLQLILEEIKVDILVSSGEDFTSRVQIKTLLDKLLAEHLRINPFEGLDKTDKRDLNNIALKLGNESYDKIQPELEGLTESLKVKNSLIREYLNSSNLSLYISMAAFIFAILLAIWQFLPNTRASQKQLVAEAIKEHVKDLNNKGKQAEV